MGVYNTTKAIELYVIWRRSDVCILCVAVITRGSLPSNSQSVDGSVRLCDIESSNN